jgi:hypothetical protein
MMPGGALAQGIDPIRRDRRTPALSTTARFYVYTDGHGNPAAPIAIPGGLYRELEITVVFV